MVTISAIARRVHSCVSVAITVKPQPIRTPIAPLRAILPGARGCGVRPASASTAEICAACRAGASAAIVDAAVPNAIPPAITHQGTRTVSMIRSARPFM